MSQRGEPTVVIRTAADGGSVRRNRHIPVADVLAREGRSLDGIDGYYSLADSVVAVRNGMVKIAAGLLVLVGTASLAKEGLLGGGDEDDGAIDARPSVPVVTIGEAHADPEALKELAATTTRADSSTEASKPAETTKKPADEPAETAQRTAAPAPSQPPAQAQPPAQTDAPAPPPQTPAPTQTQQPKPTQDSPGWQEACEDYSGGWDYGGCDYGGGWGG